MACPHLALACVCLLRAELSTNEAEEQVVDEGH